MVKTTVPLDEVLAKRYFHLKSYFDNFVDQVNSAGLSPDKYEVVITVQEKGVAPATPPDRNNFNL